MLTLTVFIKEKTLGDYLQNYKDMITFENLGIYEIAYVVQQQTHRADKTKG